MKLISTFFKILVYGTKCAIAGYKLSSSSQQICLIAGVLVWICLFCVLPAGLFLGLNVFAAYFGLCYVSRETGTLDDFKAIEARRIEKALAEIVMENELS